MSRVADIPTATVGRVVTYIRVLEELEAQNVLRASSGELARRAGVTPFQVRKDLTYFGRFGTRGIGYTVAVLRRELLRALGLDQTWNVVIVGMGRLGHAIANYPGASDYQFQNVGLFDVAPDVVGREVRGLTVQHMSQLGPFVASVAGTPRQVDMGLLTVPAEHAQAAAQALVAAGVGGILNFAPVVLQTQDLHLPEASAAPGRREVTVENVDFLAGMKRLAFYMLGPQAGPAEE